MTDATEEIIRRGRDAKYLLENETFQSAIAELREGTINGWRTSNSASASAREAMFFQMQALDAIEAALVARVAAGKFDADRLEKAAKRTSRQA